MAITPEAKELLLQHITVLDEALTDLDEVSLDWGSSKAIRLKVLALEDLVRCMGEKKDIPELH